MLNSGLSQRALEEIAGLNHAFLGLMTGCHHGGPGTWLGLESETIRRLCLLDAEALDRLGRLPFALFSLHLNDRPAWDTLLERGVADVSDPAGWPDDGSRRQQFLMMALAAMRDMAATDRFSTSRLFGLPGELATAISRTDIVWLPIMAAAIKPWLRARHADRRDWWDAIITDADLDRPGVAQRHFGVQLSLQGALGLKQARLPRGRLCRSR